MLLISTIYPSKLGTLFRHGLKVSKIKTEKNLFIYLFIHSFMLHEPTNLFHYKCHFRYFPFKSVKLFVFVVIISKCNARSMSFLLHCMDRYNVKS